MFTFLRFTTILGSKFLILYEYLHSRSMERNLRNRVLSKGSSKAHNQLDKEANILAMLFLEPQKLRRACLINVFMYIFQIAASAYKCKHAAYSADADPLFRYDFGNVVRRGYRPDVMTQVYMPRRDFPVQNNRDMVEEMAQLIAHLPLRRADDAKVLNRRGNKTIVLVF